MDDRLQEKVALVTGGARGIGKAIALKLADAGADVVVCDIDEDGARATCSQIKEMGRKSEAYKINVTDFDGVADMMKQVIDTFEKVDILVNNAGITRDKNIFLMDKTDWDSVIGINLTGYFNVTRNIIMPMLKNKNGSILNIASVSGLIGLPGQANYCSSKHGVVGFTKSLAKECGRAKVTVNAIAPGFIETEMTAKLGEDRIKELKKTIPIRRFGLVDEVAELALFLVSDKARYITGQCFTIDGGLTV